MDELTQMSADPETHAEYDASVIEMNRLYANQNLRYKEGIEKGRKDGHAEGEQIRKAHVLIHQKRLALELHLRIPAK